MTQAPTLTLTDFLLARITEDENVARAAAARIAPGLDWQFFTHGHFANDDDDAVVADLWERYDPARVLAECEAKRRIIALHTSPPEPYSQECAVCSVPYGDELRTETWPCPTLRALAAVYADHADYRDEWRPHAVG